LLRNWGGRIGVQDASGSCIVIVIVLISSGGC
jgi:hypothetical protein